MRTLITRTRAGQEFGGARALHAVARHIIHLPVKAGLQPGGQAGFGVGEIDPAHADRVEAEFAPPLSDPRNKCRAVEDGPVDRRETRPAPSILFPFVRGPDDRVDPDCR
jgi:hypothetical protein